MASGARGDGGPAQWGWGREDHEDSLGDCLVRGNDSVLALTSWKPCPSLKQLTFLRETSLGSEVGGP